VWKGLFDERFSFFNFLLSIIGVAPVDWLGSNAMGSVLLMSIWCGIGPTMIIILAALQTVPKDILEAAQIDGANVFQRYRLIVVPTISSTIMYVLITGLIGTLQAYAEFDLITGGGPGYSTTTLSMLVIRAMDNEGLGYACAMAWVICAIVLIFTLIFFRFVKSKVYYAEGSD
ncbi:MAG: sugar ABC transporter permease, partial [Clostridia bacterium]